MSLSVVIPTYDHWSLCHSLLFNIYQFNRSVDEVLVIDNGSTELDYHKGLEWWTLQRMLPIKVLELEENIGFLRACNVGVRKASGDNIILISNDVEVKTDIVSIISNKLNYEPKTIIGNRLISFDSGWNTFNGRIFPYLEGWLLAFTKTAWKDIGGFDDIFAPNDMEDVDFSTTAVSKGYTLFSMDNANISHMGAQTLKYSPEREAITIRNKAKFQEKWMK